MKALAKLATCALAALAFIGCNKTTTDTTKHVESIKIYSVDTSTGKAVKDVTGTTITVNQDYNAKWYQVQFTPSDASDTSFKVDATNGTNVVNPINYNNENKFYVEICGNGTSVVTVTTTDGSKTANITFVVSGKK